MSASGLTTGRWRAVSQSVATNRDELTGRINLNAHLLHLHAGRRVARRPARLRKLRCVASILQHRLAPPSPPVYEPAFLLLLRSHSGLQKVSEALRGMSSSSGIDHGIGHGIYTAASIASYHTSKCQVFTLGPLRTVIDHSPPNSRSFSRNTNPG